MGAAALTVGRGLLGAASGGLSFAAQLAQSMAAPPASTTDGSQHGSLLNALEERLAAMQQRIQRLLAEHGIRLDSPAELISDGLGGIELAAPHPQEEAIKQAVSSDVLLERDFNQLLSDCGNVRDEHREPIISLTIPKSQ